MSLFRHYVRPHLNNLKEKKRSASHGDSPPPSTVKRARLAEHPKKSSQRKTSDPVDFGADSDVEGEAAYGGLFQDAASDPLGREEAFKKSTSFSKGAILKNVHDHYELRQRIDQGSYGVVVFGKSRLTGDIVALKRFKPSHKKSSDGENQLDVTSVREINSLQVLPSHANIVPVLEIVGTSYGNDVYMVMRYMSHDLHRLLRKERIQRSFTPAVVKNLVRQLLEGVAHMHAHDIVHRDLKPSNLLFSDGVLRVCDFGMSRVLPSSKGRAKKNRNDASSSTSSPSSGASASSRSRSRPHYSGGSDSSRAKRSKYHDKPMTPGNDVITLYYRAPELILGATEYGTAVDMWSVGAIFAEFVCARTLFRADNELDQLRNIFESLGMPSESTMPGWDRKYSRGPLPRFEKPPTRTLSRRFSANPNSSRYLSDKGYQLLKRMLCFDPNRRISAEEALSHEWFDEKPRPCRATDMPRFEDTLSPLGESSPSGAPATSSAGFSLATAFGRK